MKHEQTTFCRLCDICCGLIATVEDGTITRLRPNPDHVASKGFSCPKGLNFHEIVHSPDRVLDPMHRRGPVNGKDSWESTDWDTAFRDIGGRLRDIIERHGPNSVALYVGTGAGFAFLHPYWAQGFMEAVGSKNLYSSATQDCSNKFVANREMYGFPMLQPVADFENGQCLIVLGANPAATKFSFKGVPHVMRRLRIAAESGSRIIHVNPRRTEAVDAGGEHLPIRPGSDVYFLLAFAGEVLRRDAIDHAAVNRYMKNLDGLRQASMNWNAERQAPLTGIPADRFLDTVSAYLEADGAALYLSTGLAMGGKGALCAWLVEAINAVTGNLDRKGGTLVGKGALMDFPRIASKFGIMLSDTRSRLGSYRVVNEIMPGSMLAEEILTPGEGQIRALFVAGGNPFVTLPNTARVEKAFMDLDLLVTVDLFRNLTGSYAHWVLPGLTSYERPDLGYIFHSMMGISDKRFLQYTDEVIPPVGNSKDELQIWSGLVKGAGLNFFGSGFLQGQIDLRKGLSRLPGILGAPFRFSHARILDRFLRFSGKPGVRTMKRRYPGGKELPNPAAGSFLGKRVLTGDGKVDLAPAAFVESACGLDVPGSDTTGPAAPLVLVNKRGFRTLNSFLQSSGSLMKGRHGSNHLHINPADAAVRNLTDGGEALVWSDWGCIRLPVHVTDRMSPGSAAIPFGWGQQRALGYGAAAALPGANVNWLTPSGPAHIDRLSLMAHLSGIAIESAPLTDRLPAVILAGGLSSRFGTNKAFARYQGESLLEKTAGIARETGMQPVLSLSAAEGYESWTEPRLYDPDPEQRTPLNGLLAAARVLPGRFMVMTVDNPKLPAEVLRLLSEASGEAGERPVVIGDRRRVFPFPGLYHASNIDAFEQAWFSRDFRLTEMIMGMDPFVIPLETVDEVDPRRNWQANINTPEDLSDSLPVG